MTWIDGNGNVMPGDRPSADRGPARPAPQAGGASRVTRLQGSQAGGAAAAAAPAGGGGGDPVDQVHAALHGLAFTVPATELFGHSLPQTDVPRYQVGLLLLVFYMVGLNGVLALLMLWLVATLSGTGAAAGAGAAPAQGGRSNAAPSTAAAAAAGSTARRTAAPAAGSIQSIRQNVEQNAMRDARVRADLERQVLALGFSREQAKLALASAVPRDNVSSAVEWLAAKATEQQQ